MKIGNLGEEEQQETGRQSSDCIVRIKNLYLRFETEEGTVRALNGVNLEIARGKVLGLVGESGSGKTVLGLSLLGLVPVPPGRYSSGSEIIFNGRNILGCTEKELELIRGTGISMIFQEPMSSLNPVFRVGDQIAESIRTRVLRKELNKDRSISLRESVRGVKGIDEARVREEVIKTLEDVRIAEPSETAKRYPHELSGGMRQRVMIAMALASRPSLLIADEPTTALDVSIQAQILSIIYDLVREYDMSVLFITHDLSVVAEVADDVCVMYAGSVVELSDAPSLFFAPKHPYTKALLDAQPELGDKRKSLETLKGGVPSLINIPPGCPFHPRCKYRFEGCDVKVPQLVRVAGGSSKLFGNGGGSSRRRIVENPVAKERTVSGKSEVACHLYPPSEDAPA